MFFDALKSAPFHTKLYELFFIKRIRVKSPIYMFVENGSSRFQESKQIIFRKIHWDFDSSTHFILLKNIYMVIFIWLYGYIYIEDQKKCKE
jgi:hypothetical protein